MPTTSIVNTLKLSDEKVEFINNMRKALNEGRDPARKDIFTRAEIRDYTKKVAKRDWAPNFIVKNEAFKTKKTGDYDMSRIDKRTKADIVETKAATAKKSKKEAKAPKAPKEAKAPKEPKPKKEKTAKAAPPAPKESLEDIDHDPLDDLGGGDDDHDFGHDPGEEEE